MADGWEKDEEEVRNKTKASVESMADVFTISSNVEGHSNIFSFCASYYLRCGVTGLLCCVWSFPILFSIRTTYLFFTYIAWHRATSHPFYLLLLFFALNVEVLEVWLVIHSILLDNRMSKSVLTLLTYILQWNVHTARNSLTHWKLKVVCWMLS